MSLPVQVNELASIASLGAGDLIPASISGLLKKVSVGQLYTALTQTGAVVSVKEPRFGAMGDGITNDIAAIQAAINTGKSVYFPDGTYFLGAFSTSGSEVSVLTITGRSFVKYFGPGTLKVNSSNSCVPKILVLDDAHDIDIDLNFTDPGYDVTVNWQGAMCVNLLGSVGDVYNIRIKGSALNAVNFFNVGNQNSTVPAKSIYNIELDLNCNNVFYGAQFRNGGDHVHGVIKTNQAQRSYFSYGAQHHKLDVFSSNHIVTNPAQDVLIKTYDGRDEHDIEINYRCLNNDAQTPCVEIENQTSTGKAVRDIRVTVNDLDSTNTNNFSVYICTRDSATGNIDATTSKIVDRVKIDGHIRNALVIGSKRTATICYIELAGDIARKMTSAQQIVVGATAAGNPGFTSNSLWRLRMPDGKTWVPFCKDQVNNLVVDIPLCNTSMGVMNLDYDVLDGYQTTNIRMHAHETVFWTMAAGVATMDSHNIEFSTTIGAVGTVSPAANSGNIRITAAGWTAAANGYVIVRYEDQQSDSSTAD